MNLALHLFRKDIRQFRLYLAIWFGLLLLNLAVNLGWVGQITYSPQHGFDQASNTWTHMLPIVIWALVMLLPTLVVLADSPARHEGFLATRPMSKRDRFLGKLLFTLTLIVAPWVLLEFIHLAVLGMPGWVVGLGTLDRFLFTLPVAIGFSAYAGLWPDLPRWARSIAIIFGCYLACGILSALFSLFFDLDHFAYAQHPAGPIVNLFLLMSLVIALFIWHSRAHRGALARWSGLVLVAVAFITLSSHWPWHPLGLHPSDPATADSLVSQSGFEVSPCRFSLAKLQQPGLASPKIRVFLTPESKPLPDNYAVEWVGLDSGLMNSNGLRMCGSAANHQQVFEGSFNNSGFETADFNAWSSVFPSDVLFRLDANYANYGNYSPDFISFNPFAFPSGAGSFDVPLTLRIRLEAQVFQWRKIADLPLTPGASATDEFGSWKYLATKAGLAQQGQWFFLQRRQIELDTASDSRYSHTASGPVSRMACLIYDPVTHTAWLPAFYPANYERRGADTALPQYFVTLNFNQRKSFTPDELARCRVIIFEKTWVGSVPKTWSSSPFTLNEKLQPAVARSSYGDQLPAAEFNRRLAALKAPAPDASRRDVSLYLLEFLRLVDARRFSLGLEDPHARQLAAYVPAHLDLFLDGLPVMESPSRDSVINAITLGASDSQEPQIIAALQRDPDLASVLLARGWLADARAQVLQLAQSQHKLPLAALQAIASFQDPQTYPRLLQEFDAESVPDVNDVLRTLPGLAPALDDIIRRQWRRDSLVCQQNNWQMFGTSFQLALSSGQDSALQRAYLFLNEPSFDQLGLDYYMVNAFKQSFLMTDLRPSERQDNEAVLAWMRRHRAEDFVFNPGLRQFVLRSNQSPPAQP